MSAMSERAASIDALIADLPPAEIKALAERLAGQVGHVLVAEVPHPDCPHQQSGDKAVGDYVMAYGGRCRGCADENGVCPTSGLPCTSADARRAVAWVLGAIRYGVTHGFIASPLALGGKDLERALANPDLIHLNMLRGGIAKPSPAQMGHLYRGDEARQLVDEVKRQNPDAFPNEWAESPLKFALEAHQLLVTAEWAITTLMARHVNAGHDDFRNADHLAETIAALCVAGDTAAWLKPAGREG